ncbi:MAG: hypothetical protein AseanaTS_16900 [Candidatus Pelagadaptatus aseana]|uniref:PilN domain-containing protein n=1 Tax=Candidatus Pelagadaptatus aseana TaxID=3120508 RepID=UPI0039B304EA
MPKSQAQQLDLQIAELREQIVQRQRIKSLVEAQNLGNADGFSGQMEGLARQIPGEMYLQGFRLESGGSQVSLTGMALKPESVPLYVEQLQGEAAFANSQFGVMAIERQTSQAAVSFRMAPAASFDQAGAQVATPTAPVQGAAPTVVEGEQP